MEGGGLFRFQDRLVVRETSFRQSASMMDSSIQEVHRALACDEGRNRLIFADVVHALGEGRSPIFLTERKDHLELMTERLRGRVRHLVVLQGGMSEKERRETSKRPAAIPDEEERLATLFLAMPVSWKGTIVQYAGRVVG